MNPGETLDHYRIEGVVAHSGMSTLFRATDVHTGKAVAIKVPDPQMEADVVYFERFRREEAIGLELDHPGVIRTLGENQRSQRYMVMEWASGQPLRQLLAREEPLPCLNPISIDRAIRITLDILGALEYIHDHGIVHRDLKPENIMVDDQDHIKIIDFGIAGQQGARRLTFGKLSKIVGTPDYISPEQAKGKRGDERTDVYAVGVMLYEMLTGKMPFQGDNALAVMNDRLLNNPIPPQEANPDLSPELQEILYRALEREPANRYARAREFAWDLEHLDRVGVVDRQELHAWKKRKTSGAKAAFSFIALALIPVAIVLLLFAIGRR